MHSAPSVSFPVGRSRDAGLLLLFFWIAGVACAAVAIRRLESLDWRAALLLASVVIAGALAGFTQARQRPGRVAYDGQSWRLAGAAAIHTAQLVPALDLQRLLLVRLYAAGQRSRWIWLERRSAPQRWLALRRAVYSRAPSADPADPIVEPSRSTGSPTSSA